MNLDLITFKIFLHNFFLSLLLLISYQYALTLHELEYHTRKPNHFEITQLIQTYNPKILCSYYLQTSIALYNDTYLYKAQLNPTKKSLLTKINSDNHIYLERDLKPRKRRQLKNSII